MHIRGICLCDVAQIKDSVRAFWRLGPHTYSWPLDLHTSDSEKKKQGEKRENI